MIDLLGLPLDEAITLAKDAGYIIKETMLVSPRKGCPGDDSRVIAVRPGEEKEITILYSNFKTVI